MDILIGFLTLIVMIDFSYMMIPRFSVKRIHSVEPICI